MTAFRTLDDVVNGLGSWEAELRSRQDRRSIFLTLYGIVASEMRDRVNEKAFTDPEWVHRYAVAFANLYRQALEDYDAGRFGNVPKLSAVSIEPDRASRYKDHAAVNDVLGSVTERATARLAALYAPGLTGMDDCAGELDEMASLLFASSGPG